MPPLTWDRLKTSPWLSTTSFPRNQDPLKVLFTDLHNGSPSLTSSVDDPSQSNEGNLEAIQMAGTRSGRKTRNNATLVDFL